MMEPIERRRFIEILKKDPLLGDVENSEAIGEPENLYKEDSDLSRQLYELEKLKLIKDLIREFEVNYELLELESSFYSLKSLCSKLQRETTFHRQGVNFQRSVRIYVDGLRLKLVKALRELICNGFWKGSDSEAIVFQPNVVDINVDNVEVEHNYREVMAFIENNYFPDQYMDNGFWMITEITFADTKEQVRGELNYIFNNFINYSSLIDQLKQILFDRNTKVLYQADSSKLNLEHVKNRVHDSADEYQNLVSRLENLITVATFLNDLSKYSNIKIVLERIGSIMSNELLKILKGNAPTILGSHSSILKKKVTELNHLLEKVSRISDSKWSHTSKEVDDIINNDQIYRNLLLDKAVQKCVNAFKKELNSRSWQTKLKTRKIKEEGSSLNMLAQAKATKEELLPPKNGSDVWDWVDESEDILESKSQNVIINGGDDDDLEAWEDEINLDLSDVDDNQNHENGHELPHSQDKESVEREEDGWDDAWKIEDDEIERIDGLKANAPDVVQGTELPEIASAILTDFRNDEAKLRSDGVSEDYLHFKSNLLQTTLFVISSTFYTEQWWRFYIDMRYIVQNDTTLLRLEEMNENKLRRDLELKMKSVYEIVERQLKIFWHNERNPNWDSIIDTLIPQIRTEFIEPMCHIKGKAMENALLRVVKFLYNDCFTAQVSKWTVISEQNSKNLSELATLLFTSTDIAELYHLPQYRELREKFGVIRNLLPLHLKDIMEMFYNGDFYLFTTEEIVQWIKLLFAETPFREDAINDIYEVRRATIDDDSA